MMQWAEHAATFQCDSASLVAVTAVPERRASRGVVIVVGGPQYRAGSHRQFTLLCRSLAAAGIPAMRFDYRGMGDSEGDPRSFEDVTDDLRAAVDHFVRENESIKEVVLWALCDGASAALFYAYTDPRVTGLVLLNPWVRTAEGVARAYLRGYYVRRLVDPQLWGKILSGRFSMREAGRGLVANLVAAAGPEEDADGSSRVERTSLPLPQRMLEGWRRFRGRILLILSEDDLTADEFRAQIASDKGWRRAVAEPRVSLCEVAGANHTFAREDWRAQVEQITARWVKSW
jgi:exosortase A-associated hydrolase 1